jgi:hypothetical protein
MSAQPDRYRDGQPTDTNIRNHDSRKHGPQYKCPMCDAAFGLCNDLERHEVTRHTKDFPQDPIMIFRCSNFACTTPEKEYLRQDNFRRHVKRCGKVKGKGKAKEEDEMCPVRGRRSSCEQSVSGTVRDI